MSSLRQQLEKIKSQVNFTKESHIEVRDKYGLVIAGDEKKPYVPCRTGTAFHECDTEVRMILGPYGSGKSTIACAEIILRAMAMTPCTDGVRRSRWALVRNTYADLEATTLKTWLEWYEELGIVRSRKSPRIWYQHTFNDGNGPIELELMFIPLDRPDQIGKLQSLELTGVYMNELPQMPEIAFTHFKARTHRYPHKRDLTGDYWYGVVADGNPPETDHWIYNLFEVQKPEQHIIFHQPPAMLKTESGYEPNPDAENIEHLSGGFDYYRFMMTGQSEEFIRVFVQGEYGTVVAGKRVYTNYNDDFHSVEVIDICEGHTILLAWDYGIVCPACLLCQYVENRLNVIKEFIGEYITVKELYEQSVLPFLGKYCGGLTLEVIGDPANTYGGFEQLEELDLPVEAAKTNKIDSRVGSVREFLSRLVGGKPAIIVSKEGCPKLRQGFNGKYAYKRLKVIGEERYQDFPDKTHPYSDIHDCLQYAAMHFNVYKPKEEENYEEYWQDDRGRSKIGGY